MRFWIKIALLSFVTYLACNVSMLWQDRQDRRTLMHEVEKMTRESFVEVQSGGCSPKTIARLSAAQRRLATADARWERDAAHLLLLN
jgi:hypothetical protein